MLGTLGGHIIRHWQLLAMRRDMLSIEQTTVLRGPNLWAGEPVIVLKVSLGALEERLQRETPVFFERLVDLLPELAEHRATVYRPERGLERLLLGPLILA